MEMESEQCSYIDDYKVHGQLADGGQASVYFCSKNNQIYAAKVYRIGHNDAFQKQVEFLKKLQFQYLINLVGFNRQAKTKLPNKQESIRSVIFLQFAQGGELFQYIARKGPFDPKICRVFMKMLISTIEYLNSVGVTHRDLKPENILFDKHFNLKVSDFGLSRFSDGDDGDGILYSKLGTQGYKPPEMQSGEYTGLQADLFAAGVILFVMYVGTLPFFSTKKIDKMYRLIRQNNFTKFWSLHQKSKKKTISDSLKKLLNSFFSANIYMRPTFQQLKNNQWLNQQQATQNQIQFQMKKRYNSILQSDIKKQQYQKIKLSILQSSMLQQNQYHLEKNERTRSIGLCHTSFRYQNVDISVLPLSNKYQLVGIKVEPTVLLAFFENYLKEAFQNKNIFLQDSAFDIEPVCYSMDYDQEDQIIKISLMFKFKGDLQQVEEQSIEELIVHGHLVKLRDEKVSIDWEKVSGNVFWLTSVVCSLNSELKMLA